MTLVLFLTVLGCGAPQPPDVVAPDGPETATTSIDDDTATAPGDACEAGRTLVLDASFHQLDILARRAPLIDALEPVLGEAAEEWRSLQDVPSNDFEGGGESAQAMKAGFDAHNAINSASFEACGFPALDSLHLVTREDNDCYFVSCEPTLVVASTLPCFAVTPIEMELTPEVTMTDEVYGSVDCESGEATRLAIDGTWELVPTFEEGVILADVWVLSVDVPAGTPAASVLEDRQLVRDAVDASQRDPLVIVVPGSELDGLVAGRDLPAGHILIAGDFIVP